MRIFSAALLPLLAACAAEPEQSEELAGLSSDCALDGARAFSRTCRIESLVDGWLVRHPDGGFRRIEVTADGSFVTDGAEPVTVGEDGALTVGDDRYRIAW